MQHFHTCNNHAIIIMQLTNTWVRELTGPFSLSFLSHIYPQLNELWKASFVYSEMMSEVMPVTNFDKRPAPTPLTALVSLESLHVRFP